MEYSNSHIYHRSLFFQDVITKFSNILHKCLYFYTLCNGQGKDTSFPFLHFRICNILLLHNFHGNYQEFLRQWFDLNKRRNLYLFYRCHNYDYRWYLLNDKKHNVYHNKSKPIFLLLPHFYLRIKYILNLIFFPILLYHFH